MFEKLKFWRYSEQTKMVFMKWAYLVIVVACTITLTVLINQNRALVEDIQQDRVQVAYDLCLDQNARHDELISFIQDESRKSGTPPSPALIKFINLLAEKRNCVEYVSNLLGVPNPDGSLVK